MITKHARFLILSILTTCLATRVLASDQGPIVWWSFDEGTGESVTDRSGGVSDSVLGHFEFREGVSGTALKFDGFTTRIRRVAEAGPQLGRSFTVSAWIAPQAYPWNWSAIIDQEIGFAEGYFFGIDAQGYLGLSLAINGNWQWCVSDSTVPFMEKWSHVAGVFDADKGISVFIDGVRSGSCSAVGEPTYAAEAPLLVGRNLTMLPPTALVREWVSIPTSYSFDGLLDEVRIFNRALSEVEINQEFRRLETPGPPPLEWRRLPQMPEGNHPFGARYTRLRFYPEWDQLWPVSEHPDVVVMFDEIPGKMAFWRGTNYNLNLITENGRWVGDQSAEDGSNWNLRDGPEEVYPTGCMEHMSDKQNRYSHIRVIENSAARVVVHWRYALADVRYRIANTDPITGWGDWADEYYTIYPDGVAVRSARVFGADTGYSLTEPTVLNQPGEKAEDNVDKQAVTLANLAGEVEQMVWDPWPTTQLSDSAVAVVNLKSRFRPFYVYEPGTEVGPYGAVSEVRPDYSAFPTWNHWPVSQIASDGRYALAPDRVSSSALLSPDPPMVKETPSSPWTARFILGLTDKAVEDVLPLARSWLVPPDVRVHTGGWRYDGYDRDQRAFLFEKLGPGTSELELSWSCSFESPIVNPALVVKNWGSSEVDIRLDGKLLERGRTFRSSLLQTMRGTDLIVWIKATSLRPTAVTIAPHER